MQVMMHMYVIASTLFRSIIDHCQYTLGCFLEMATGEQIDLQRERRWPNQTAGGSLWVKVKPEQEGREDESDEEMGEAPKLAYDPDSGKLYRTDMLSDDSDFD
jgi:hypothetical protein